LVASVRAVRTTRAIQTVSANKRWTSCIGIGASSHRFKRPASTWTTTSADTTRAARFTSGNDVTEATIVVNVINESEPIAANRGWRKRRRTNK